jgi:pimeloyl-ACP methyl ester carboxylesterase
MTPRVRLALISTFIAIGVLILIGATYQGVATALERRRHPHPGRLIDVGGHQLQIYCVGSGTPRVVLEAPEITMSAAWGWVQRDLARTSRVCSYDRAGLGWSEAGDKPYDPGRVPEELRSLLAAANEPGPYVLAGSSLGAAFIRRFAGLYPEETAGLVFIAEAENVDGDASFLTMSPWLARTGLLRAMPLLSARWKGLPPASAVVVRAFLHRPDHLTRASREVARWGDAVHLGREAALRDGLPVSTVNANLNDERDARRATSAIAGVVATARRRPPIADRRPR